MSTISHGSLTTGENIHTAIRWTYADSSARTGASGFVASDVYKFAVQTDDGSLWMLTAITPTWQQVVPGAGDLSVTGIQFDTGISTPSHSEGLMFWDADNDCPSVYNSESDVSMQIGQEVWVRVRNESGANIGNNALVYISGSNDAPLVDLAQADDIATSFVIGASTHVIENNSYGWVTRFGIVRNVNTSSFSGGDPLYLSDSVAGGVTNSKPTGSNVIVHVGNVGVVDASVGNVLVNPCDPMGWFGDGTNYTQFEADGTMVHNGNATVWEDENVNLTPLTTGGTAPGNVSVASTGIRVRSFAVGEDLEFILEIPHAYRINSTITPHIHFVGDSAPTGTDYVAFELDYTVLNVDDVASTATTISTGDIAVDTQWKRVDANFATISNDELGGQALCKVRRVAASGDAYSGECGVLTLGFHYERDMGGSRQITTK